MMSRFPTEAVCFRTASPACPPPPPPNPLFARTTSEPATGRGYTSWAAATQVGEVGRRVRRAEEPWKARKVERGATTEARPRAEETLSVRHINVVYRVRFPTMVATAAVERLT